MIESVFRIIVEFAFVQTARQLMRPFGVRLPEWVEVIFGLIIWLNVGTIVFALWIR